MLLLTVTVLRNLFCHLNSLKALSQMQKVNFLTYQYFKVKYLLSTIFQY